MENWRDISEAPTDGTPIFCKIRVEVGDEVGSPEYEPMVTYTAAEFMMGEWISCESGNTVYPVAWIEVPA